MDQSSLRDLLFRFPRSLPVAAIDDAYSDPVPVCRELSTPAGYVDALYINALGRLILAEFKLWRNPQARREVIGQILDYTKEIASWNYEDLQREVSRALGRKGNIPYELVRAQTPGVDEAEFVDNVSRHLRRGEFLLLIVGDGIREGVENTVHFVQSHSGLHFNLALGEAALYRDTAGRIIVQPRVLTRTEVVRRVVVEGGLAEDFAAEDVHGDEAPSVHERENIRFWTAVLDDYAFSDVTVELPEVTKAPQLFVKVRRSGWSDWGLSFVGYLDRSYSVVGCCLTCRKGIQPAAEVYEDVKRSLHELRKELGDDLEHWERAGLLLSTLYRHPRIVIKPPVSAPIGGELTRLLTTRSVSIRYVCGSTSLSLQLPGSGAHRHQVLAPSSLPASSAFLAPMEPSCYHSVDSHLGAFLCITVTCLYCYIILHIFPQATQTSPFSTNKFDEALDIRAVTPVRLSTLRSNTPPASELMRPPSNRPVTKRRPRA